MVRFTRVARLQRKEGQPDFQIQFYAVNKKGEHGAAGMYPSRYAVCDENGPRHVDMVSLFER